MSHPPGDRPAGGPGSSEAIALSDEIRGALSFQTYESAAMIAGVQLRTMKKHRAENGWFMEVFRLQEGRPSAGRDGQPDWEVRQLSMSYAEPNRLNAFHIHPRIAQNEVWTVVHGLLAVWLIDCRKGSATEGVRQRVLLSGEAPAQLYIPAGVAHGYRAGASGATLLYAMDQQFDPSDSNEGRLPWNHFGEHLWAEDRG